MSNFHELIDLAKQTAIEVAHKLSSSQSNMREIQSVTLSGKETKIIADRVSEEIIIKCLEKTGISILSEESGYVNHDDNSNLLWIIDPLDGSLNYSRNSGPSAISIALWEGMIPIFGVIYLIDDMLLVWGGENYGSWLDDTAITTSNINEKSKATLCTGIPARFDSNNIDAIKDFNDIIFEFSKVRMLGSAACSLVKVAQGAADVYWEKDIMLWDVAAGIPIVSGAKGEVRFAKANTKFKYSVSASNPLLINSCKIS